MNFRILTLSVLLTFAYSLTAQDAKAPKYLTKQAFPDSVMQLSLLELDSSFIDFSEILAKHKGRKVVIDFWASWCRDCIEGLPKLEKLRAKTKKLDVDYIFISMDKEDEKWKYAIKRLNIIGEHYRIGIGWKNTLSNYIDLDWIPRYIVLDENGQIIMPKAISAGNKELFKVLKK